MAFNMKVAEQIGYKPTIDFILNCDELYKEIGTNEK